MIVITSPFFWLALLGGVLIVAVVLIWSIWGRLPVKMSTAGVFVSSQGAIHQAADTGGIVTSLAVQTGDFVEQGDLLLTLSDADLQRELDSLTERREKVEAVTLESREDVITADNRELINLKIQLAASGLDPDAYSQQFHMIRSALLDSLDSEIEKYEYALQKTQVTAQESGIVSELKVGVGSAVSQGSEIVTIRRQSEEHHILCYIPLSVGKKVAPGMEVLVCPTTVNQQEYGHMQAEVIAVDDYMATTSSIRDALGNDLLAQSFLQSGPVVGVVCRLKTDESTASGYWWSNAKGGTLVIPEGTLVTADIVTEEQAPISLLLPFLRDQFSSAMGPAQVLDGGGR